ncbi:hypothetical protein BDV19DRAFT_385184 [Aspergillus venezuelensis]
MLQTSEAGTCPDYSLLSGLEKIALSNIPERSTFTTQDSLEYLWRGLDLPEEPLRSVSIPSDEKTTLPKLGHLAQSSIALSILLASTIYGLRNSIPQPKVSVNRSHASIEFKSERLYAIDGKSTASAWEPLSGVNKTLGGYVRVHDGFPHHRAGTKALLSCDPEATREDISSVISTWRSLDLESAAVNTGLVMSALRDYSQWDNHPQFQSLPTFPIHLRKIADAPRLNTSPSARLGPGNDKPRRSLRVLEFSRVIAAPVAGKILAAHGANVLWVTSPNLPDSPSLDREFARGKHTIQLDLDSEHNLAPALNLAKDADVFIQGYHPGALSAKGL